MIATGTVSINFPTSIPAREAYEAAWRVCGAPRFGPGSLNWLTRGIRQWLQRPDGECRAEMLALCEDHPETESYPLTAYLPASIARGVRRRIAWLPPLQGRDRRSRPKRKRRGIPGQLADLILIRHVVPLMLAQAPAVAGRMDGAVVPGKAKPLRQTG